MKQHILSQKQRNNVNLRFLAKKFLFATFEKEICFQELRIYITIAVRKKKNFLVFRLSAGQLI